METLLASLIAVLRVYSQSYFTRQLGGWLLAMVIVLVTEKRWIDWCTISVKLSDSMTSLFVSVKSL